MTQEDESTNDLVDALYDYIADHGVRDVLYVFSGVVRTEGDDMNEGDPGMGDFLIDFGVDLNKLADDYEGKIT